MHDLLNRVPPRPSEILSCHGALEGHRMYIDWNRFRGFVYGTWEPEVVYAVTKAVKAGMKIAARRAQRWMNTLPSQSSR